MSDPVVTVVFVVRFLHSADWQLGMTRHFLGAEAQARFAAARTEVIRTIGSLAVSEGCTFVVVAGDVFESNHVERQVVVRALEAMSATPAVTFHLLPGNHDPLDAASVFRSPTFVEHRPGNVLLVELDGPAVSVTPHAVGTWHFERAEFDLAGEADCAALAGWLDALPHKERTVVRLSLIGQLTLVAKARLDDTLDHHRDLFAAVEVWAPSSDLVVLPDDGDFADLEFAGFARNAVADLRLAAVDGDHAEAARDALGLLHRLARSGR